ncbi:MAG: hypothetical protein KDA28_17515, partial [Phycisphaerales bacterium]|nr:hypothetical protein [Phycisphaerales bacterium]
MHRLPASAFINRDLSWLEFNRRVLAQAQDPRTPLIERAKFIAIFASNLDEFVMKRIGLLKRQIDAGIEQRSPDGRTPREQLDASRTLMLELIRDLCTCYDDLRHALDERGIEIRRHDELDEADRRQVNTWYRTNVFPVLTPLAVDPGHRFPFISNLSTSLGVMLSRPGHAERSFARVKIPTTIP